MKAVVAARVYTPTAAPARPSEWFVRSHCSSTFKEADVSQGIVVRHFIAEEQTPYVACAFEMKTTHSLYSLIPDGETISTRAAQNRMVRRQVSSMRVTASMDGGGSTSAQAVGGAAPQHADKTTPFPPPHQPSRRSRPAASVDLTKSPFFHARQNLSKSTPVGTISVETPWNGAMTSSLVSPMQVSGLKHSVARRSFLSVVRGHCQPFLLPACFHGACCCFVVLAMCRCFLAGVAGPESGRRVMQPHITNTPNAARYDPNRLSNLLRSWAKGERLACS